ncbi:hypothetical protein [Nostoc sp. WHI]|uniref:hypothetical protein n=1 Tax=Nostoc sp. WHI TaxID=2650611 RepID=UPI0018C55D7D|nr:hypothetical protein [Nostoc sp. WHI]MBG1266828.1 hypothetical protein [Nostoc sp. WHI]
MTITDFLTRLTPTSRRSDCYVRCRGFRPDTKRAAYRSRGLKPSKFVKPPISRHWGYSRFALQQQTQDSIIS